MRLNRLLIAASVAAAMSGAATAATLDTGNYTITYDDTVFGGISGWWWSIPGQGFNFAIPTSVSVDAITGTASFALPSFTVTPDAGYSLYGPINLTIGSISVAAAAGGSVDASFAGTLALDGGAPISLGSSTADYTTTTPGGYTVGALVLTSTTPSAAFNSLSFSSGMLNLSASGQFATAFLGSGNTPAQFQISFLVAAVPEPESYAMMLAGLGMLGLIGRRRKSKKGRAA